MYILYAFLAGTFTWFITTLGSAIVFFFKKINKEIVCKILAFAGGIMLSASFYSLLSPAVELANELEFKPFIICTFGFLVGGLFLYLIDIIFTKKIKNKKASMMLLLSITIHNIPEGLSLGVAFGSIYFGLKGATLTGAILLTIGIGLQNFPEGIAVSLPMKKEKISSGKAFLLGSLSAIVEPISALVGAILVTKVRFALPFCLSFAAGAMIYVTIKEIVPESMESQNKNLMSMIFITSFVLMMFLDLVF